jgi:serine protease inhibitor
MMNQKGRFPIGFIEELQAQILEMKYTLGKLSMFILLPPWSDDNMKGLQEVMSIQKCSSNHQRAALSSTILRQADSPAIRDIQDDVGI